MGRAGTLQSTAGIAKARPYFFNVFRYFSPDTPKTEADPGSAEAASAKLERHPALLNRTLKKQPVRTPQ